MTDPLAAKVAAIGSSMSPYPPSFNGDPVLYGTSLASLMTITMFACVTWSWMARDLWRDRYRDHPLSLAFLFRAMIATVSFVSIIRCLPEVAYMTCYGEVTGYRMSQILVVKRMADTLALPTVAGWMGMLVLIYPFVIVALHARDVRQVVVTDPLSVWPRLMRAAVMALVILCIAALIALSKGAMGHH